MTVAAALTLLVVTAVLVALARDLARPSVVVLTAVVILLVTGVISAEQAFQGFANPAPITVAALYVVARAVEQTGLLEPVVAWALSGRGGVQRQVARIVAPTALASAVMNNTPIVAMAAPSVTQWATQHGAAASRYLIPLSYAAILGGTITAIGTSTNLVVSGLLVQAGEPPIGIFELTPVGLPLAIAGCAVIAGLSCRLLPERRSAFDEVEASVRKFTVAMEVVAGGPLDGTTLADGGLRALGGLYCVHVDRGSRRIAPVAPTEHLQGGDVLTFAGQVDQVVHLQRRRGLVSTEDRHLTEINAGPGQFFEVVIGLQSPLVGRTLKSTGFRARYGAAVIALHRSGQQVDASLGTVRLRVGDTLLVLADDEFRRRWRDGDDFLIIAPLEGRPPTTTARASLVACGVIAMVVVTGAGLMPILHAVLLAALGLVATGTLTVQEARDSIDADVLIVIAAAFGLGAAVTASGLASMLAEGIVSVTAPLGLVGALAGVLVATVLLTETISNNAAAVLAFPLALSTAEALGAASRGFAIAVALGASMAFLTPIGYQTNLMVYGLGGYRFSDYLRLGIPVALTAIAITLILIPRVWPL